MLGKAQRPWRTLRDCVAAMLHTMSVPTSMWSCAMSTAAYLRNRTFSRAVGLTGGVPLTFLTSASHDASVFRVFCCAAFAKIPDVERRKPKSFRGAFV
jgi:hypothetical protein